VTLEQYARTAVLKKAVAFTFHFGDGFDSSHLAPEQGSGDSKILFREPGRHRHMSIR
jgi:hypothetical protein